MRFTPSFILSGLFGVAGLTSLASADLVISDTFTDVNGTSISSHVPAPVNMPQHSYVQTGSFNFFPGTINNDGTNSFFQTNANDGAAISLASTGSYTKQPILTLQADIATGTIAGSDGLTAGDGRTNGRGLGLGFHPSGIDTGGGAEVISGSWFSGLIVAPTGALELYENGGYVAGVAYSGGTFTGNTVSTLTYTVNTSTGALSGVSLSGSTADYSSLITAAGTFFTDANTFSAALTSSSSQAGTAGSFDNFSVTSTPEPASLGLVGLAAIGLLGRRRRA